MVKTRSIASLSAAVEERRCSATRKSRHRRSITMPQKKRKLRNEQSNKHASDTKSPGTSETTKDPDHFVAGLGNSSSQAIKRPAKRPITVRISRSKQKGHMEITTDVVEISANNMSDVGNSCHTAKVMCKKRSGSSISKDLKANKVSKFQRPASGKENVEKKKKSTAIVEIASDNGLLHPKGLVENTGACDVLRGEDQETVPNKKMKIEESTSNCSQGSVNDLNGDKALDMDKVKGWTAEQDAALQSAYFQVRPCPNFWVEVSKKVPGKTAKECFDRYYNAYPTPPAAQPRSRKTITESPVRGISFPSPLCSKSHFGRGKQGLLKAHKTVRHILRQQTAADDAYEADVFSTVEQPIAEESKDAFFSPASTYTGKASSSECSYATPADHTGALRRSKRELKSVSSKSYVNNDRDVSSGCRDLLSPEVLKRETNPARLDRYLDMLHRRHVDKKTISSRGPPENSKFTSTISAARNAIISTATDVLRVLTKQSMIEEESSSLSDELDEEDLMDLLDD